MKASPTVSPSNRSRQRGLSMLELVVTFAVILIVSAFGAPTLVRAYKSYQVDASAYRLVGVMNFTRTEAIRRNTLINCQTTPTGAYWTFWTDSNQNNAVDNGEMQFLTSNSANLLPAASVPNAGALNAAAGIAAPNVLSGVVGAISYDSRGAVAPPAVFVMYIGNPSDPTAGYRAVILRPTGIPQIWATNGAGGWRQIG